MVGRARSEKTEGDVMSQLWVLRQCTASGLLID